MAEGDLWYVGWVDTRSIRDSQSWTTHSCGSPLASTALGGGQSGDGELLHYCSTLTMYLHMRAQRIQCYFWVLSCFQQGKDKENIALAALTCGYLTTLCRWVHTKWVSLQYLTPVSVLQHVSTLRHLKGFCLCIEEWLSLCLSRFEILNCIHMNSDVEQQLQQAIYQWHNIT